MLHDLFPRTLSDSYRGSGVALWLFVPVLIVKTLMAFNFMGANPFIDVSQVLERVDGVPMSTLTAPAVGSILDLASAWGAALLTLCLAAWIIIVRYRSGAPMAVLLILIEQLLRTGRDLTREALKLVHSATSLASGVWINMGITTMLVVALMLALIPRRNTSAH